MFTKKKKGTELINGVIGQFTTMIDELDQGTADCNAECGDIATQIDELEKRDSFLQTHMSRASGVASKLRNLLNGE